jgi:hypothetical protein
VVEAKPVEETCRWRRPSRWRRGSGAAAAGSALGRDVGGGEGAARPAAPVTTRGGKGRVCGDDQGGKSSKCRRASIYPGVNSFVTGNK